VSDEPIIFGRPWFGDEEEHLLLQTLRSGWIGQGPVVEEFERRLATYVGAANAVAVSSCTAALHLSLVAAGVGAGDEVVTTPFTFVATVNAIEHTGATPVLVDVDAKSLNLTVEAVADAMTSRTRAVVPVHFAGLPVDSDAFARLSAETGVWVIEDAAHAVGAVGGARRVGGTGAERVVSCFSFYPNKNLATAEGGAVCTASDAFAERVRQLRLHGLRSDAWKRYREATYAPSLATLAGFKVNWTDLQAAIAIPQLERLEGFLATREYLATRYDELIESVAGVTPTYRPTPSLEVRHALHLYQVALDAPPPARDRVVESMRASGIGAAVHYIGVNRHPYYAERFAGEYPVSDWASDCLLTLPLHPHMSRRDIERVVRALAEGIERATR
jgi:dTDP-4-amino-4,6-dideoxygalactose transaminase